MDEQIAQLLQTLLGSAVIGLVVAVVTLWREFTAHKLHVAEAYMVNADADEIKQEIRALRDVVYRVAVKMEVPVFSEPYKR